MHMLSLSKYKSQFEILDSNPVDRKEYHKVKSTLNKYASKIFYYNVTRCEEWVNNEVKGNLGDLPHGTIVEGFDLTKLKYTEDLEDFDGFQDFVLVRLVKGKKNHNSRAIKLKRLEDEGVMIEEEETKKKKNKKKEDKEDKDYEDFMDDIEADQNLQKVVPIYKNKDRLKHMTEDELNR